MFILYLLTNNNRFLELTQMNDSTEECSPFKDRKKK